MVNPDRNLYEPPYDDALLYDTDLEPERPRSRPLVVLLGIVVLAAFAGVVWVAYNQGVKQGQNGLPILTADAGPTRIVPDPATSSPAIDPAPAKSYDRLMSSDPESDQVNMLPKPEQPKTTPSPQDLAVAPATTEATGGKFGTKASDFDAPVDPGMDTTVGSISGSPQTSEDITASLPQAAKPVQTALATTKAAPAKEIIAPAKPIAAKPAPVEIAPPPAETTEAPAATPAPSGVMIQLGSFPNAALAASAWSKIKSSNQDLLADHSPAIKPAEIPGKGTWYRLRVGGFADKTEAQTACQQLTTSGQACIIAAK